MKEEYILAPAYAASLNELPRDVLGATVVRLWNEVAFPDAWEELITAGQVFRSRHLEAVDRCSYPRACV